MPQTQSGQHMNERACCMVWQSVLADLHCFFQKQRYYVGPSRLDMKDNIQFTFPYLNSTAQERPYADQDRQNLAQCTREQCFISTESNSPG